MWALAGGGCLLQGCCSCCKNSFTEQTMKQQIRLIYVMTFILFVLPFILILFLLDGYYWWTSILNYFITSCSPGQTIGVCLGVSAIFRMSFALLLMFGLILLACTTKNDCARVVNEELWPIKIFGVMITFIISLWISNNFFITYSAVATIFSFFFLLFQIIMIIDICYLWGEKWVSYYDEGQRFWGILLILTSLGLYVGTVYWNVMLYEWFGGCGVGTMAITLNIILIIIVTILTLSGIHPHGSLLTTGSVSIFTTYLTWSALTSQRNCNNWTSTDNTFLTQFLVGLALIIISLTYVSTGTREDSSGNLGMGNNINLAAGMLENKKTEEEKEKEKELDEEKADNQGLQQEQPPVVQKRIRGDLADYQGNKYLYFHTIMVLASLYIPLLLTNYGNAFIGGQEYSAFASDTLSLWVKLINTWVTMSFFIWTLVAPKLFPNRDFVSQ